MVLSQIVCLSLTVALFCIEEFIICSMMKFCCHRIIFPPLAIALWVRESFTLWWFIFFGKMKNHANVWHIKASRKNVYNSLSRVNQQHRLSSFLSHCHRLLAISPKNGKNKKCTKNTNFFFFCSDFFFLCFYVCLFFRGCKAAASTPNVEVTKNVL